ncbi:hypothetical protein AMTRI_Chr03g148150 [Amborella trichopoda]
MEPPPSQGFSGYEAKDYKVEDEEDRVTNYCCSCCYDCMDNCLGYCCGSY